MTTEEMLSKLKIISGKTNEEMLSVYLELAAAVIIEKAYPFRTDVTEVPERYQMVQLEVANYLIKKRGAEGQTSHNENGISRGYESASVPASMLKRVIPEPKVPYDEAEEGEEAGAEEEVEVGLS